MKDFLSNPWVKRAVSVFNIAYFAVITLLTYATFLYDLEFTEGREQSFFTVYVIASVVFLGLMLYTRREAVTSVLGALMLPVCFFLILFNMGNWILVIPPFVVALIMFFASGSKETLKVILGTIYLLLYVLGIVAYFVLNILFGGSSVETELNADLDTGSTVYQIYRDNFDKIVEYTSDENAISPDGKYKIVLYDVKNSDKGAVKICVVPYGQDIELKFFTLKQKGIKKTISNKGTRGVVPSFGWIEENGVLKVEYRLSEYDDLKATSVTTLPDKQYLEFLGIS